jgi:hypothetical protein
MVKKINIRELKDNVNYLMYTMFNCNLEELKIANNICDKIGGGINETIDKSITSN